MITRGKFQLYLTSWRRLYGTQYLDDNVINLYIRLLLDNVHCLQPNKIQQQQQQQYHQMTTFFYSCLLNPNITENRMKRMAWNESLFTYNKIFIPINENYHWMLIIIEPKQRRIRCFNSLLSDTLKIKVKFEVIMKFIQLIEKDVDVYKWKRIIVENIAKQKNSYDCGVFVLEYVRELLRGNNKPNFTNENGNMNQISSKND